VDKYPLFLDSSRSLASPVVTLSYVDPGYATVAGFANHLNAYSQLLPELTEFRFLFISNSAVHFGDAEKCFSSLVGAPNSTDIAAEVLRYFRLRKAWDLKKYALFSNTEIEWLNGATRRFAGQRLDSLHVAWCAGQVTDDDVRRDLPASAFQRKAEFATYLVRDSGRDKTSIGEDLKRASVPDFRRKQFSLQRRADGNFVERKEIHPDATTRKDAAKFR